MNSYDEEMLECMICGLKSNQLISHVTRTHRLQVQAYYEMFPGSKLSKLTQGQIDKMKATKNKKETNNKKYKIEHENRVKEVSNLEPLVCKVCGYESSLSIISHITRKHKMSMNEYRETYPECVVQRSSKSQIESQKESYKKAIEDPKVKERMLEKRSFPSEIKHWTRKGFSEEEARQKVSEFQRSQSIKGNNEKTKKLRSQKCSGENNPMSLASIAERNQTTIEEARKMTPCYGRKGKLHPMFGKKHTPEAIRKIGNYINTSRISKIEHEMSDFIVSVYGGLKNEHVFGWCCDYVNHEKKIVVEFFGDFWHHNPRKYPKDWQNPFTKRTSDYVYERDNRKINELKNHGYSVIIVWEHDWRNNKEQEVQKITNAFNSV